MCNLEELERLTEKGDTNAMTEFGILCYDTGDFEKAIKLLEAVILCDTLNSTALWALGRAYAEHDGGSEERVDQIVKLLTQASLLRHGQATLCLGKVYHNRYDRKLNVEPDYEKAEHWYSEALKMGLKVSLFYLGKLYHDKSMQTDDEAVVAYTYYNSFYVLTRQDKSTFSSLRDEAVKVMAEIEKSADEANGSGKLFRAFRKSNTHLLDRLSCSLKLST